MRIGYACKLVGVSNVDFKSCTLKNASSGKITELIKHNINSLNNIIDYNINNNIKLFRISSDLIPFGSNEVNKIEWWKIFYDDLKTIGNKIKENNIRVSLHPGQYTVLNSTNKDVVLKAIEDLVYHTRILDSLGMNSEHKVVLHIGGAYDDKRLSIERFIENYKLLPDNVKMRLVIENDDRIYNIEEVLGIGVKLNIPVIFDNLHHQLNSPKQKMTEAYWIDQCRATWRKGDGNQKIHYSQQAENAKIGSHSNSISINQFMTFYEMLKQKDIDIMLEVKDKNLSCVKCINCLSEKMDLNILENEWSKYKYTILERSHSAYEEISELFNGKNRISAIHFYNLIENGLKNEGDWGRFTNAALQVWDILHSHANEKERHNFFKYMERYQSHNAGISIVKNYLKKLVIKYRNSELLNSLYFYI